MNESTYRFLDYELNVAAGVLMQKNAAVPIRPKTLATLVFLLEHQNEIVTKEDILAAVWADTDVQDQAVFQSISELRSLFKGHECIETVRGRGYRWRLRPGVHDDSKTHQLDRWFQAIAACLVLLAGGVLWWQFAGDTNSVTVNIRPARILNEVTGESDLSATSLDRMLVQQLNRMGWDTQPLRSENRSDDQFEISIEMDPAAAGTTLNFRFTGRSIQHSGHITSATPLGAIRDLAAELHDMLSLLVEDDAADINASHLFAKAKAHLDKEEYSLAEAYLTVALTELPDQMTLERALAYTYKQMGRYDDALDLAFKTHNSADQKEHRTDRMMSAMMASKLLLEKGNVAESNTFANEALNLASNMNDLLIVAEAQEQLGEISLMRGNTSTGKEQLMVALKYFRTFCPSGESRVSRRLHELES